jgi:glutaredoxin
MPNVEASAASVEPDAMASPPPGTPTPSASAAPRVPSAAEIENALRSVRVVMYSTEWCGVCQRAREFLGNHAIAFREVDIERDPVARAEVKRVTGRTAVPVLEIDGVIAGSGFSESATAQAIAASVERRLGVSGIQLRRVRQ